MKDAIYDYATKSWPILKGCKNDLPCAENCWAKGECHRLAANPNPAISEFHDGLTTRHPVSNAVMWSGTVKLNEAHLEDPLRWKQHQRVAVAYHGDIGLATDEQLDRIFAVMAVCPQHTFLVLTKRPERLEKWISQMAWTSGTPLPNVWLGVSITNQEDADERIPALLKIPAARRWVSIEPMLGPVDLSSLPSVSGIGRYLDSLSDAGAHESDLPGKLDWVVLGGESGPTARPLDPAWVRGVRDECQAAGVPFWFKQWGEWGPVPSGHCVEAIEALVEHVWEPEVRSTYRVGKRAAGCKLDGAEWKQLPKGAL